VTRILAEQLAGVCELRTYPYSADPAGFFRDIGGCDVMVASRLHAAVFGYLRQVPLVVLSYHPKCLGFAKDIALDAACTLDAGQFSPADLGRAVEFAAGGKQLAARPVSDARLSARRHLAEFFEDVPQESRAVAIPKSAIYPATPGSNSAGCAEVGSPFLTS
jgi:polysaccharide pyruvyl transferase WcaK-like protein